MTSHLDSHSTSHRPDRSSWVFRRHFAGHRFAVLVCAGLVFGSATSVLAADRIVLRSLQIVVDRTVESFDAEGVLLDNRTRLGWHEIERATVGGGKQEAFDRQLRELGNPLYRIRQRLATADFAGAGEPAETLFERYGNSRSETAYLVQQATMWGRIAVGQRERALSAYLACFESLRAKPAMAQSLPGDRRLKLDPATGLTPELVPIWFDVRAAREQLPAVYRQIAQMSKPRPEGIYLYYASLALAAGDEAAADKVLKAIKSPARGCEELLVILAADREVRGNKPGAAIAQLELLAPNLAADHRSLAWYWLGTAKLADPEEANRQAGMLQLLRIPALSGQGQPELAAAALHQVMRALAQRGDATGSVSVRRELLERYGQTYHALQVRGSTETEKKP